MVETNETKQAQRRQIINGWHKKQSQQGCTPANDFESLL